MNLGDSCVKSSLTINPRWQAPEVIADGSYSTSGNISQAPEGGGVILAQHILAYQTTPQMHPSDTTTHALQQVADTSCPQVHPFHHIMMIFSSMPSLPQQGSPDDSLPDVALVLFLRRMAECLP